VLKNSRHCLRLPAGVIIALLVCGAPNIHAQDPGPTIEETDEAAQLATIDFIVGNSLFVLLHEFGHVVIRDFDLPILGLEENSADTLAAVSLIVADENRPEQQPRLSEYLAMAILGNMLIWETGLEKSSDEILFWAQHEVSVRRANRLVCLLYGSDTEEFGWIVEAVDMPESRSEACEDEFTIARNAAEKVLATFPRRSGSIARIWRHALGGKRLDTA